MTRLTELDQTILGVVGLHSPCTGYRVRRVFRDSLSSHWSGSAGAIYPALKRLERLGYIKAQADFSTKRPARQLMLSARGKNAIIEWFSPPLDQSAIMDLDPLRTRVRMLGLIPVAEQKAFAQAAISQLHAVEQGALDLLRKSERGTDVFKTLICKRALDSVRERKRWLQEVAEVIASQEQEKEP